VLILAFGFLALSAVLDYRLRAAGVPMRGPFRRIGVAAGFVAALGPVVVMARIGLAEGAAAYLVGIVFSFAIGFVHSSLWPLISLAAGVFGFGLLAGSLVAVMA